MAIKVRHEGSMSVGAAAGAGSGAARNRLETAKLAQNQPQHVQTLQPAHASAPGGGGGSAPLAHAPSGASAASAPLTHAPSPSYRGGAGRGGADRPGEPSNAPVSLTDYKVTGTDFFSRPDEYSSWDPEKRVWLRTYLPGEREADALGRTGRVKNDLDKEMYEFRHLLGVEGDIMRERLKMPGTPARETPPAPAVASPFATAEAAGVDNAGDAGLQSAYYDRDLPGVAEIREKLGDEKTKRLFDSALREAGSILSEAKRQFGTSPRNAFNVLSSGGRDLYETFKSILESGGEAAPAAPQNAVAEAPASVDARPVSAQSWLFGGEADGADGGPSGPERRLYADSLGGMIGLLTSMNGYA